MTVFSFIWCQTNNHDPHRRDVEWNGMGYVGTCRHCETPIYRHKRRDWRKRGHGWESQRKGLKT